MAKPVKIQEKVCIVHITTYPPRECGIATFCADLISYGDELFSGAVETRVVAMTKTGTKPHKYGAKVIFEISENNKEDYLTAADKLNAMPEVKIVAIEHEFGIFGNNYGENLILFLDKIEKPVVVTLHTVLSTPPEEMKKVMEKIILHANYLIVMTELSKKLLMEVYGATVDKIKVIPHGIHPQLYADTIYSKEKLNLKDKLVLTTFGLLSRGKGIEYAIEALPQIVAKYPNVVYLVLGETHPVVLESEGEVYRNKLIAQAAKLGMEDHVVFHNQYLAKDELLLYLQATDIYLALSQDPNQTVSGTLTYALGAGRAVISTAFMQAKEIVTPEVGVLIGFNEHQSITKEVLGLLDDRGRLLSLGKAAYFSTRNMTWANVALSYMGVFSSLLPSISSNNKYMLPVKIDHLKKLTDEFGIFQFALLNDPDPKWGYTLDDNARALVALSWCNSLGPSSELESLIDIYLRFIERAAKPAGGFVNYFNGEKIAHDEFYKAENLEDTSARALWALAVAGTSNAPTEIKTRAQELFQQQFILHENVTSPRAAAFYIKAFGAHVSNKEHSEEILSRVKQYADFLVDLFQRSSDGEWQWFEESLTYSNGLLPEALLVAYTIIEDPIYFEVAKKSLDFLLEHSFEGDVCVPVGQAGWFKKGSKKERYDQQPEEVSALVLALHRMVLISSEPVYSRKMILTFDWFLGNNLSKQVVYTHSTGGCYDGIIKGGVNLNQGAESTISYLLARLAMEVTQQ